MEFRRRSTHFTSVFLELIYTLLILGALQGLLLALFLATRHTNHTANELLAAAMLALSMALLESVCYGRGYYRSFPYIIGVSEPLVFVFGPILYLYARTVSMGANSFRKASLLHFLPAALVALYLAPFYVQKGAAKVAFVEKLMADGPPRDVAFIQNLQIPQGLVYVFLTIMLLRRHRLNLRETHSYLERINLLWLQNLTIGIVVVWGLATLLEVLDISGLQVGVAGSVTVPLATAVMIYAIGYMGLRQPEIFHRPPPAVIPTAQPQFAMAGGAQAEPETGAVYEKSGLTQLQAEEHMQRLRELMAEKQPFKNSLLTLQDLAAELAVSEHHLSQVINTQFGKNFYDFVNGYRIEEIKRRLRDKESQHLTILAIALDAGFNTKSSFNTFFKKQTGMTPSEYRTQRALEQSPGVN